MHVCMSDVALAVMIREYVQIMLIMYNYAYP